MKNLSTLLLAMICLFAWPANAQETTEIIQSWDLTTYSQTTIDHLAADTENWEFNEKGRYVYKHTTDGNELKANGVIIKETAGLFIGAGIEYGSLLLRHAMGKNNGLQMQRNRPIRIDNLLAGQMVMIEMISSSKESHGIAAVSNLEGNYGEGTYKAQNLNNYSLRVIEDGSVSFTNSGGVVYKSINISKVVPDTRPQVAEVTCQIQDVDTVVNGRNTIFKRVSLSCETPQAEIYYTTMPYANIRYDSQKYQGELLFDKRCKLRAYARIDDSYRDSEEMEQLIDVPLHMPFEGKPWILDPENLDRGAIATEISNDTYLINWRWLVDDPEDICFNVYCDSTKINTTPLRKTNISHRSTDGSKYYVEAVSDGQVMERSEVRFLKDGHWEIALNRPSASGYEYIPGDCMAADLDGDGCYEIVMKWDPSNQKDNSHSGVTGNVLIDAYELDGQQLWRIDLGRNIRAGAHYTQLMVYDLDGDGKAEVACKTAAGTIDGKGNYVIMNNDDPQADYRSSYNGKEGIVITGPEYLSVFSGLTGEELATTAYIPARNYISNWGDSYGNRSERYLACVAYLNGETPSLIMCRGYYTSAFLWAVDFDGKELKTRWLHESTKAGIGAYGEGAHSIATGDVDGDGCDEIVYGACCIDNDGRLIYRTGLGHGDALHVGDFNPDRPGLEVMMVHEETDAAYGIEMRDALTGEVFAGTFAGTDVGRGLCADINKNHRGCEFWGHGYDIYNAQGEVFASKRPTVNFRSYWDGDIQEELTEKGVIDKSDGTSSKTLVNFVSKYGVGTNLIKATPCLQADIFGDWREEQIYYDNATKSKLMIFSTPYETLYKVPCLMQDHHYRMATVWQTTAYNQPPHLSYYLPDYIDYLDQKEAGLQTPVSASPIIESRYYDLSGRRMQTAEQGIFIREDIHQDGSKSRSKIMMP